MFRYEYSRPFIWSGGALGQREAEESSQQPVNLSWSSAWEKVKHEGKVMLRGKTAENTCTL